MITIILFALLALITQTFLPIQNLQCDSLVRGARSRSYENEQFGNDVLDWTQIGSSSIPIRLSDGRLSTQQIFHFQKGKAFKIKITSSDLTVVERGYQSSTATSVQLLGVKNQNIFVKQITNKSFIYAIYRSDYYSQSTNLDRLAIQALTFPQNDIRYGLQFSYLIDIMYGIISVIFTNNASTYIFIKNTDTSGAFQKFKKVADLKLNIIGGTKQILFDSKTRSYYREGETNYSAQPARSAISGKEFGAVLYENIKFYNFNNRFFVSSYTQTSIVKCGYGWYGYNTGYNLQDQGYDQASNMIPKIYCNMENLVFISTNKFSYTRINTNLQQKQYIYDLTTQTLAGLAQGSSDYIQMKNDFLNALQVSFDHQKIFVMSSSDVSIYEISALFSDLQNITVNKIAQIQLSDSTAIQINGVMRNSLKLEIKCACMTTKIMGLSCFSDNLKCRTSVSFSSAVCTKPYVDSDPFFL